MELKEKFDAQILEKIKEEQIKPKARWTFLLKDYTIWAFGLLSLLIGSMAVAVLIYLIRNNDWDIYTELSGSLLEFAILTLPYYWLLFLIIFIVVVNYNIKHTKKGYKYSLPLIMTSSISISVILGVLFFNLGLGRAIDDVFAENIVYYDKFFNPMISVWDRPDQGRLMGMVIARLNDCQYQLVDINRNEWLVDLIKESELDCPDIFVGRPIKLLGRVEGDYYFLVDRIFYNNGPGREFIRKEGRDMMHRAPEMMDEFMRMHEIRLRIDKIMEMQESTSSIRSIE